MLQDSDFACAVGNLRVSQRNPKRHREIYNDTEILEITRILIKPRAQLLDHALLLEAPEAVASLCADLVRNAGWPFATKSNPRAPPVSSTSGASAASQWCTSICSAVARRCGWRSSIGIIKSAKGAATSSSIASPGRPNGGGLRAHLLCAREIRPRAAVEGQTHVPRFKSPETAETAFRTYSNRSNAKRAIETTFLFS